MTAERRAVTTLNKKRYSTLHAQLQASLGEEATAVALDIICDVLAFDPTLRTYTPGEVAARQEQLKQRMREQGLSYYDVKGRAYYHAHKQQCMEAAHRYREARRARQQC